MEPYFIDSALCNLADKKRGDPVLVNMDHINILLKKREDLKCCWITTHKNIRYNRKALYGLLKPRLSVQQILDVDPICIILEIGRGKIVLAGGAVKSAWDQTPPNDYDMFFYNVTPTEAESLIAECVKAITGIGPCTFTRSKYVTTIITHKYVKIQFIRRIYKTKGQILLGFDLAGARIGYDMDGIFATIDGAVALAFGGFVLDLTQRSTSFGTRLQKYNMEKNYDIYMPNLNRLCDITTPDLRIRYRPEFDAVSIGLLGGKIPSDYESARDDGCHLNWWYINNNFHEYVTFESENYQNIADLDEETVRKSITSGPIWKIRCEGPINLKTLKKILGTDYAEFVQELIINENFDAANKILRNREAYFVNIGAKIAAEMNSDGWRIDDPMSQTFGKFNPIIADPRDWFGAENYNPFVVGLTTERVITFRLCYGRLCAELSIDLPVDIDKLLLRYWFEAEAKDAVLRIFDLTGISKNSK